MKSALRCLCLLAVAIICESYTVSEEEFKKLQIEEPEGCEISPSVDHYEMIMTCPGFTMTMTTHNIAKKSSDLSLREEIVELRSVVQCSDNSSPYAHLRLTNSKRNSLMLKNCPLPEHGSFGDGWPNLEMFKFENYGTIEPLTRQHFSGLDNVWKLILFTSSDHYMADDVLGDLTNLAELYVSVRHANKNIFKDLTKLEYLHLEINANDDIDNFDTSEMKHLPVFKTLELTTSSFRRLTKRFFEGCPFVETLTFQFNKIAAIDGNAFEPLTNLRHVVMKYNELTSLPEGLFSTNKNLETFTIRTYMSDNTITSLPSGFFSHLPNLREITVHCKLNSIQADLIRGSTNLEVLDLRFNSLTSMPMDLLEDHSKLEEIKLSGNEIQRPPGDMFSNKSPLTKIRF